MAKDYTAFFPTLKGKSWRGKQECETGSLGICCISTKLNRFLGVSINSAFLIFKTLPFSHYRFVFWQLFTCCRFHLTSSLPESIRAAWSPGGRRELSTVEGQCNYNYVRAARLNSPKQKSGRNARSPKARLLELARAPQVSPKPAEGDLYASARSLACPLLRLQVQAYCFTPLQIPRSAGLHTCSGTLLEPAPPPRPRAPRSESRARPADR